MSESKASRTLVKSPPELWSEVSSAASLQRHMDRFGEIRITELEPETAVAWEGEHARGTITLEPSGWGTKVSITAEPLPPPADGGEQEEVGGPFPGEPLAPPADGGKQAVGRIEPHPTDEAGGRIGPGRSGEAGGRIEPDPSGEADGRIEPDPSGEAGGRIEPDRSGEAGGRIEPDPPAARGTSVELPFDGVETEVRALNALLERNRRELELRKRRWPTRLADTVRRWFAPRAHPDNGPVAVEPTPPATPVDPRTVPAAAAPASPEPDPAAGSSKPSVAVKRAPAEDQQADTVALAAALESLGQAHHRPFSRA